MLKKNIKIVLGQLSYVVFNPLSSKIIICFHGFGQQAMDYAWLAEKHPAYKVIAIDLFFHGSSSLSNSKALNHKDWVLFFNQLIIEEELTTFTLTGYSMGGRFALSTLKSYPHMVDALYLIAADGIIASKLFKLATGTAFMRVIFKWMLNSYPVFIHLSNSLTHMGILNKGLQKFAQLHMKEKVERNRIYNSWTSFRHLKLAPKEMANLSKEYNVPLHISLGKYDRVIPVDRIKPFLMKNEFLKYKTVDITHHKLFYYDFFKL